MNPLIAITGYKNSGKNAVCNVLHDHYGYVITGFADILKAMVYDINPVVDVKKVTAFPGGGPDWYAGEPEQVTVELVRVKDVVDEYGWEIAKEKFPELRRLLQFMGTEGGRKHLGENVWVDAWKKSVTPLLDLTEVGVCVSDMRFLNEAAAVRDLGGLCWRVKRPGYVAGTHDSELEQDQIKVDFWFLNDGSLDDLSEQVRNVMTA